jgi:hypothetical protein
VATVKIPTSDKVTTYANGATHKIYLTYVPKEVPNAGSGANCKPVAEDGEEEEEDESGDSPSDPGSKGGFNS